MALSIRDMRTHAHKFVQTYTEAHKENTEVRSFLNFFGISRRRLASFKKPIKVNENAPNVSNNPDQAYYLLYKAT